jgi:hypothetical protein
MGSTEKKKIKKTAIQTSHCSRVVVFISLINFIFKCTKLFYSCSRFSINRADYLTDCGLIPILQIDFIRQTVKNKRHRIEFFWFFAEDKQALNQNLSNQELKAFKL